MLVLLLTGCAGTEPGSRGSQGAGVAEISIGPTTARCLVIQVVGPVPAGGGPALVATKQFDLEPQASTVFVLDGLPLGTDTFTAQAYTVRCAQIGGSAPEWGSLPVTADLVAGTPATVTLTLVLLSQSGGVAVVTVDFPSGGPTVTKFPVPSGSGALGITAGPDGGLWFAEQNSFRIGRMAPDGAGGAEYPVAPASLRSQPDGIALGSDGALWFAEPTTSSIGRLTTAGVLQELSIPWGGAAERIVPGLDGSLYFGTFNRIGAVTTGGVFTQYTLPGGASAMDVTAGPDGNIWFADLAGSLGRLSPSQGGTVTEFPLASGGRPTAITLGPDGNLWFAEAIDNRLGRAQVDPATGTVTIAEFPLLTPNSAPGSICPGPDGNVWFTEGLAGNVGVITPAGAITEFQVAAASTTAGVSVLAGITAGPDGNIWFSLPGTGQVARLSLH